MKLRPYQRSAIDAIRERWDAGDPNALLVLATGLGKALRNDQRVLRPDGTWTPICEMRVGDFVVGRDGRATAVVGVYPQGLRQMRRVSFVDGAVVFCDPEHLWDVRVSHEGAELCAPAPRTGGFGEVVGFRSGVITMETGSVAGHIAQGHEVETVGALWHAPLPAIASRARRIESVTPAGEAEATCIKVAAADGLFVTEGYVVTHNTVVFCTLGRELRMEGIGKTLVLAHRKELLDQAREKWLAVEPDAHVGIYQGARREFYADVICASVQSCYPDVIDGNGNVTRRGRIHDLPLKDIGLVIVDEVHHLASDTQRALLATIREHNPNAVMLGVTATPYRNDNKGLGDFFDRVAFRMGISEGIDQGFLSPLRGCRVELDIDLSQVKTSKRTGDFVESDLGNVMDTESARREIVRAWVREMGPGTDAGGKDGRFTAAFTPTVESTQHLCQEFVDAGVSAVWISGAMSKADRTRALAAYQSGEARVIVNCSILTEGWDAPHTSCVLIARPTQSIGMFAQMVGRATRLFPGKADAVVMDCVGASRLGLASLADLSTGAESKAPGIDPEPEEEEELVLDKDAKQLDLPEMAQTVQVRGCTVYDIDLFGGQVQWVRIRGMRVAILDIGLHIVLYQEPQAGGFTALLVDDTGAIPLAKNRPEREALAHAEQIAMVKGRAKYLKPSPFLSRMPASEKQTLLIQRLVAQNVQLGSFNTADVPHQMSGPQASAWIAYLKTRRMWMRQRMAVQNGAAA